MVNPETLKNLTRENERFIRIVETASQYPLESFGTGRFVLLATNPGLLNLSLDPQKDESKFRLLRKYMSEGRRRDIETGLIPALDELFNAAYGVNLRGTQRIFADDDDRLVRPRHEGDMRFSLAQRISPTRVAKLPREVAEEMRKIRDGKERNGRATWDEIMMRIIYKKNFSEFMRGNVSAIPNNLEMHIREKRFESSALKTCAKARKIYAPTSRELLGISADQDNPVSAEELIGFYETYMRLGLTSGDFLIFASENPPTSLMSGKKRKEELRELDEYRGRFAGNQFNEIILDNFQVDMAGAEIVLPHDQIKRLISVVNDRLGYRFQRIPYKTEDPKSRERDGAYVWAIRGTSDAVAAEIKVVDTATMLIGVYGCSSSEIKPHPTFKLFKGQEIREALDRGNPKLEQIVANTCAFYKLKPRQFYL